VTGDEEVDQLVADVGRVEVRRQHDFQQVIVMAESLLAAPGDDLVGHPMQVVRIALDVALLAPGQELRQPAGAQNFGWVRRSSNTVIAPASAAVIHVSSSAGGGLCATTGDHRR
jgi:hypothetical protein